jgi:putative transposase
LWHDLLDGDVTVGEFRWKEHRINWTLHVTVEYSVAEPEEPENPTPVDFAIGESKLLTGCACQDGTSTQPMLFDGSRARHLRKEMHTTLRRLQERNADWRIDDDLALAF